MSSRASTVGPARFSTFLSTMAEDEEYDEEMEAKLENPSPSGSRRALALTVII